MSSFAPVCHPGRFVVSVPPQHEHRAGELAAPIGFVVPEIELERAVLGAGRIDGLLIAEAPFVLGTGFRADRAEGCTPAFHQEVEVHLGAVADECLRQGVRLAHQVPVKPCERHRRVHAFERRLRRHHVERGEARDPAGVIERHAMRDPSAAIVPDDVPAIVSEGIHHRDEIVRGGALAVHRVIARRRLRLVAVAVAAHVRRDDGVGAGKLGRDLVPHDVGLRIAVQEQRTARPLSLPPCTHVQPTPLTSTRAVVNPSNIVNLLGSVCREVPAGAACLPETSARRLKPLAPGAASL